MKTLIADTADVVMRRKSDGKTIFTAEAQIAGISQEISENEVRGGIGNKKISVIRSDKNINLTTKMALFDLEYLSMTQGVAVESGTATVTKKEELSVVGSGTLTVTVTGTPANNKVTLINSKGVSQEFTAVAKACTVTAPFATAGEKVTALYKDTVTGNIVKLQSDTFSENYEVEYRTIAYNPVTNQVVADIYFQFDNCLPSGAFEISLENGNALAPELKFQALTAPNSSDIGRIVEVPRDVA
jgi:hypothetical protein